ncbi:unnamed protein product [Oreochromis niloticus]|nr:unnamed protein product [Mustela putorius furo]
MCAAQDYNTQTPLVVSTDELLPIIKNAFNKLSDVQWTLIENGAWDSDIQAVLADMIAEIIQITSANILRRALPIIQSDASADIETNPSFGDSISTAIANVLNIPKQICESAKKLTKMVEEEISNKVKLIVTLVRENSNLPPDPAVYVSGAILNIRKLRVMVSHALSCLKRYASKLKCSCMEKESDSSKSESSKDNIESGISAELATLEVSEILTKWIQDSDFTDDELSDDDRDMESEPPAKIEKLLEKRESSESGECAEVERQAESITPKTRKEEIVDDIVNIILDNLQCSDTDYSCHSEKCTSPQSRANVGIIFDKVREFFTSRAPSAPQKSRKLHFSKFAGKHFKKMKGELKTTVKKSKNYFISLSKVTHSPETERTGSHDSMSFNLPGSACETPRSNSSMSVRAPSRSSSTLESMIKSSTPTSFNVIKSNISDIYSEFTKEKEHDIIQERLENIKISEKVKNFSRELTEKMYDHLMKSRVYQIPTTFMGRSLSDSVISRTPQPVAESRVYFSPEVLYVIIEDAIGKFLQKILLLVDDETIDEIVQSEKVSDAVQYIQKVNAKGQTRAKDTESDYFQKSGRESTKPCPSRPASLEKQVKSPEKSSTSSRSSSTPVLKRMEEEMSGKSEDRFSKKLEDIPLEKSEEKPSEKSEEKPSEKSEEKPSEKSEEKSSEKSEEKSSEKSEEKPSEKSEEKPLEKSEEKSSEKSEEKLSDVSDELVFQIIASLLVQYKKSLKKPLASIPNEKLKDIADHLKNLVQPEISSEGSVTNLDKNVSQLTKKLLKGLIKEFGSPEQVMNAALACDSSFDEAILKHLKINLGVLTSPRQKSRIARFFSAVGRAIMKPFRCCFKGSDD